VHDPVPDALQVPASSVVAVDELLEPFELHPDTAAIIPTPKNNIRSPRIFSLHKSKYDR
jgi:hypothetical protein